MKTSGQKLKDVDPGRRTKIKATPALVKTGHGILKREAEDKPLTEDWAEHRKRERALEERHVL
jgi:hypothetical protein